MGKMSWFITGVVTGLAAAAIGQELQKPPEKRANTGIPRAMRSCSRTRLVWAGA